MGGHHHDLGNKLKLSRRLPRRMSTRGWSKPISASRRRSIGHCYGGRAHRGGRGHGAIEAMAHESAPVGSLACGEFPYRISDIWIR